MTVRGRKRKQFGPVWVNLASTGFLRWRVTGWGLRIGRWSWSARTRQYRVNLPGPWTYSGGGRRVSPRRGDR